MKVLTINASPKAQGNTALALSTVADVLRDQGIHVDSIHIGRERLHGCIGCGACAKQKNMQCQFTDDPVNDWIQQMHQADGLAIGSPVYFAGITGPLKCFLDRAFLVAASNGGLFRHKVGIAATALRRGGAVPAFDQIIKYFSASEMFIPSGNYWNMAYGMMPGEAAQDGEGLQSLQLAGANMAWLLKLMEHGKGTIPAPAPAKKIRTNFIK